MPTIQGEITAYIPGANLSFIRPEDLLGPHAFKHLTFSANDMCSVGWVKVGNATVTVELESENAIVLNAIDALRAEQAAIRAKATADCTALDVKINNLLALENKPTKS
jgi:hypothetical protein